MMWRLRGLCLLTALVVTSCAAFASDISLGSLAQQGKWHELADEIQKDVDKGESVSSFRLMFLAGAYCEIRQYRKALVAADLMEKHIAGGDRSYFGGDLTPYPEIVRATVTLDQGLYKEAIRHGNIALQKLNPNQFFYRQQLMQTSFYLAMASALGGKTDDARAGLERIRGVSTAVSNLGPDKFNYMARIHMALREYDKALEAINNDEAKVSGFLTLFYDPTFQNLPKFFIRAKGLLETNHVKEAKEAYDQLLKHPQIGEFGEIYWVALHDRARIALQEGDRDTALKLLRQAVEVLERQRSSIDSEAGRIGFVGDKQAVYQLLVSLLITDGQDAAAFEYVERSKARALVDLLASQKNFKSAAQNAGVDGTLKKLSAAEEELVVRPASAQSTEQTRTRNLVVQYREELQAQAPELASLVAVTSTPSTVIQALLPRDQALLEYYYTDQELVAFIATASAIKAVKLTRAGLEDDVNGFRRCIMNPAGDCMEQSQKLHARLIAPLVASLQVKKLVIVPHGVLHYLPFNALHSGASYLIDSYSTRLEPSASVLHLLSSRKSAGAIGTLLLGNPNLGDPEGDLKFAEEETMAVAKLVRDPKVLLRDAATKSAVMSEGEKFAIVHFATHGVFELKEPLNSALLLAPGGEESRLTVSDLYTLKLNADLVTLSACETALGKISNGDDVVGFTRGLLFAGTSSIVSSLWSVDDRATRELMEAFYKNLQQLDKQESLRRAQLTVKGQRPHPFFWAAFQLTGRE